MLAYAFTKYIDIIACIVLLVAFLWGIYLFGIEESLRWLLVKRKVRPLDSLLDIPAIKLKRKYFFQKKKLSVFHMNLMNNIMIRAKLHQTLEYLLNDEYDEYE